jgi:tRNA guanosine-2'-O-methyltransferase
VGLEQSTRSLRLGAPGVTLPERMVLVLGAELRGMPAEVLAALDVVVEIPQVGQVRSMNVHVSASLLVWEYTRQRIAEGEARAAAASTAT